MAETQQIVKMKVTQNKTSVNLEDASEDILQQVIMMSLVK